MAAPSGLREALPERIVVGLIGMGDMGCLYADRLAACDDVAQILACDLPTQLPRLRERYRGNAKVELVENGALVSRAADIIIYSVEAANVAKVAQAYGPATKVGAVVIGQASVKQIEVEAFTKHLPPDVSIFPVHSLHGPFVDTAGQTLVTVALRVAPAVATRLHDIFKRAFGYRIVAMTAEQHDTVTANTQVLTHLAFEAMGTAWGAMGCYPWETASYVGGIDNVKVLACLRIYASKAHIYCGLALLNPRAKQQVQQYNRSVSELFKLMVLERTEEMRARLIAARDAVFGDRREAILLPDDVLQEFSLGKAPGPREAKPPNSHLSILAMVDSWYKLGIQPYDDLICETPVFRLRLGIAEYLFTNPGMLEESISTACNEKSIRADDFEFTAAVREWATVIGYGDTDGYNAQFERTRAFFADRLADGMKMSSKLIGRLAQAKRS